MGQEPTQAWHDPQEHGSTALERLSTFSDAVFAIAMTPVGSAGGTAG